MINLSRIAAHRLNAQPYAWAEINGLYAAPDAAALAATYPHDNFKTVSGYGGEKDYEYEARSLIHMGADSLSHADELSDAWRTLGRSLLSSGYREAMTALTGIDLMTAPMEVNVFHYGPGASLGPHPDLPDKVVTHILYFNEAWDCKDGGCLAILGSSRADDIVSEVAPIIGNSAVLVRSQSSWHAVSRVVDHHHSSRRSVTVTFYQPSSQSSMWPPGDTTALHSYTAPGNAG
jgi:hypothetical protein